MLYGGIEAGGTKFVCAVADETKVIERVVIDTRGPQETMADVIAFFEQYEIVALGIGCFGPIDINPNSPTYGYILSTPKIAWQQYDFLGALKAKFAIPMYFETDVNVAAFGESILGAAQDVRSCVYYTIGTGVGGGYVANGEFLKTLLHPEMGHFHLKRLPDDEFVGHCPFHKDCVEGLVAGPAIEARAGKKAYDLAKDDQIWEITAKYIAQLLQTTTMILSPERIILGGGVMKQEQLFPLVRKYFLEYVADYIDFKGLGVDMETYIVPPGIPDQSAILGAIELAKSLVK
jgi:Transcriptional regulator/sugar kinase